MKEIILDVHSTYCENQTKRERENKNEWADYCIRTPKKIMFLAGNQFYLITYFTCMEQGGRLDFIQDIIKQCLGSTKIFPKYEVNRCRVNEDLKEYRLRGKALKKYIEQVIKSVDNLIDKINNNLKQTTNGNS